jgi:predicted dehydrogenase
MTSTRRSFLGATAAALGLPAVQARAAGETLNVGCIGSGGRCQHLMRSLAGIKNVRIAAVCDIWDVHLNKGKELADPKAFVTRQYKDLLARKDIDAVLIGSPDHWHVPMTIDSVEAGKDVYVEKPLTHDLDEGKRVIDAVRRSRRIVQVGTQQRSMPHIVQAKELHDAGRLGKVLKVRMSWNRNTDRIRRHKLGVDPKSLDWNAFLGSARKQEFDEYLFRNWRWFWDFGGGLFTDLMVHWIDVAHWFAGVDHPRKAVALGEHFSSKGVWETPDTVQTLLSYDNGVQMHFEGTFSNARAGAMIEFLGTDATLYIDRGRFELQPEPRAKVKAEELVVGNGRKGQDFYDKPDGERLHLENWVSAVRERTQPSAPVEAGVSAAAAAHLANKALRGTGAAEWPS